MQFKEWIKDYMGTWEVAEARPEVRRDYKVTAGYFELGWAHRVVLEPVREREPAFQMGNPDPRNFARGRRGAHLDITDIYIPKEAYAILHRLERNLTSLTIECINRANGTMMVEIEEASLMQVRDTPYGRSFDLQFLLPNDKYKQYTKPESNKQAAKLLLKR